MKKKILAFLIALVSVLTLSVIFSACEDENGGNGEVTENDLIAEYALTSRVIDGNETVNDYPESKLILRANQEGALVSEAIGGSREISWTFKDNVITIKLKDEAEPLNPITLKYVDGKLIHSQTTTEEIPSTSYLEFTKITVAS